jgi:hypothetical protein
MVVATVRFYTHGVRAVHKTEHLSAVYGSYGKFKNMESPPPEGSSNILIIRFLWVTIALIFFP